MKNRLTLIFAGSFVLLLLALMVAFNHQKPRLMILHSFAEDGPWETAVDGGIRRELARNRQPIATRWHYMSFSSQMGARQWAAASQNSRGVIDAWRPDVLVAIGEEAQDYVGRYYVNRSDLRVVYAMGEEPASFGYPAAPNVTGVREVLPLAQIVEVLRHLDRPGLRIRALGMDDATGQAERQQVQNFAWAPHQLVAVQLVPDYGAWQQAVRAAARDADVLLVLSFHGLPQSAGDARPVDNHVLSDWTERNSKPLPIAVRESYVAGGGALAVVPAPEGIGEQVARKALATLAEARRGGPLPPPEDSVDFQIALRPHRLAARQLTLPTIYTQAARASHTLYLQPQRTAPGN